MAIRPTHKCHTCKEIFPNQEMINYASPKSQTAYWYCMKCYEERVAQDNFIMAVCSIFGIKNPGPRIWTERKRLIENYGYTDDMIVDCLDYIYNVEKKKKLTETLFLVNPYTMDKMKQYKKAQERASMQLAAATNTTMHEYIAPIQENPVKKKTFDPDEWLD